jgi:hypothetical protein
MAAVSQLETAIMFPEDVFALTLEVLTEEVAGTPLAAPDPIQTDTYLARSILQKAIRRGLTPLALRAAATLLLLDKRTLWRRLLVTALEDLGIGEIDLLARIVSSMRNSSWRRRVGGDWPVICTLITQACAGTRCQSANDLWNVARSDPGLNPFKAALCDAELPDLLSLMTDESLPISKRGAAVLIALGEDAGPASPTHIMPDAGAIFSAFASAGRYSHVAALYQEAYRLSHLALAPLSLCLWNESQGMGLEGIDDDMPPVTWIGDVPGYALDQYTRPGLAALRRFAHTNPSWTAFAQAWDIPRAVWPKAVGELHFRGESAGVTNRRIWGMGQALYQRSTVLDCFMPEQAVPEGLLLIRQESPHMAKLRAGQLHTHHPA